MSKLSVMCAGCGGGYSVSGNNSQAAIDIHKISNGWVAVDAHKECAGVHGTPDLCTSCKVAGAETKCPQCTTWVIADMGLTSPRDDAQFATIQADMTTLKTKIEA